MSAGLHEAIVPFEAALKLTHILSVEIAVARVADVATFFNFSEEDKQRQ